MSTYAQPEIAVNGNTYRLHTAADQLVTLHVELPNRLREELRADARNHGRTIKATVEAALTAYLAGHPNN